MMMATAFGVTVLVVDGHSGDYTFFNSPTSDDDWSAGEQLHGQDCVITPAPTPAPPRRRRSGRRRDRRLSNFDDEGRRLEGRRRDDGRRLQHETHRNLPPVNETTELSFCFGSCYPTDGSCTPAPTPSPAPTPTNYNLTFYLNASNIIAGSDTSCPTGADPVAFNPVATQSCGSGGSEMLTEGACRYYINYWNRQSGSERRRDRRLTNFDDNGRRLSGRRREPGRRRAAGVVTCDQWCGNANMICAGMYDDITNDCTAKTANDQPSDWPGQAASSATRAIRLTLIGSATASIR